MKKNSIISMTYEAAVHPIQVVTVYFLVLQGGRYSPKGRGSLGPDGIVWYSWKDSDYYSLRKVTMMIRPRNFRSHLSP